MGYAGYTPAKLPPSKLSDVEAALRAVTSVESLAIIGTLCRNCAIQPKEEKYRRIKLSNKKIAHAIVDSEGALDAMLKLGWVKDTEDGEVLVLPEGRYLNMDTVRKVDTAREQLEKTNRDAARLGKKPSSSDLQKERIRAQIEADKKERAVAEPVVAASVAQSLPSGANVHQGSY
mmetsp:Transcript_22808/g.63340  ORF Transcript_22808/g.63340 Transcript_22808/m.63340 type:complete len:175 (-) Transcript_22808:393-917(-)|eukprot:CAMPEP_0117657976 /NCGR_PEP_ID=MMETSP0804-20121206/5615_1 /TAXON_ID=1074897 /ORGANISM="Tetraselmis astigmatica, Strain CCMP880" /LENGTH=174 /DNA_ID=CAMNT_0005464461 /DNA_START=95 /DNA_END=619 /DNA_ORIENTATION=-